MILGYILATILDVHSSCLAISAGNREVLLPFKSCSSISSYSIVSTTAVVSFVKLNGKHKKLNRFILIAGISAHSLAAVYNYRSLNRK